MSSYTDTQLHYEIISSHNPKGFFADGGGLPPLSLFFLASVADFAAAGFAAVETAGLLANPAGALGFGPVGAFCAPPAAGFAGVFAGTGLNAADLAGADAGFDGTVFAVAELTVFVMTVVEPGFD